MNLHEEKILISLEVGCVKYSYKFKIYFKVNKHQVDGSKKQTNNQAQ